MAEAILQQWLLLHHVPGLGPARIAGLRKRLGQPASILGTDIATLRACGLDSALAQALLVAGQPGSKTWQRARADLDWQNQHPDNHLLCPDHTDYPALLARLPDPPAILYLKGNRAALRLPAVGMVGSRNASHYGRETAIRLAHDLGRRGLAVVSGLARGIDAASHHGSVRGGGHTLAVLGSGLEKIYPAANRGLADAIREQGLLVSEFARDLPPRAGQFPRRNRLIAGLSLGVLVVEAGLRSGSLITARMALEQNREVMAVPGPISAPGSRGCHQLLRDGAVLVESAHDVMDALASPLCQIAAGLGQQILDDPDPVPPGTSTMAAPPPPGRAEQRLFDSLDVRPCSFDLLLQRSGLPATEVSRLLLRWRLEGRVVAAGEGYRRADIADGHGAP